MEVAGQHILLFSVFSSHHPRDGRTKALTTFLRREQRFDSFYLRVISIALPLASIIPCPRRVVYSVQVSEDCSLSCSLLEGRAPSGAWDLLSGQSHLSGGQIPCLHSGSHAHFLMCNSACGTNQTLRGVSWFLSFGLSQPMVIMFWDSHLASRSQLFCKAFSSQDYVALGHHHTGTDTIGNKLHLWTPAGSGPPMFWSWCHLVYSK